MFTLPHIHSWSHTIVCYVSLLILTTINALSTQASPTPSHSSTASRSDPSQSPETHKVIHKGAHLSYRVFGSGRPLLVINGGFGTDSVGFEGLAQQLGSAHQVILFDRRGVGESTMSEINQRNMTMDLLVGDIEAIRKDLKLASWSVLGHSFGGMLAAHYTAIHPSSVDLLIFSSSAGIDLTLFSTDNKAPIHAQLSEQDRAQLTHLEAQYRAGDHSDELLTRFSEILARAYVVRDELSPWVALRLRRSNHAVGQLLSADLKRINFDTKPALKTFTKPVLIIQGQQDIMIKEIAQVTHQTLPKSRLVIIEDCGHYGWLDQPEVYLSTVLKFLNRSSSLRR